MNASTMICDVHSRHDALDRRDQSAGEAGEERADDEHAGIERADIGAERAQHLAVERRRAHHPSGGAARQHEPAGDGDREAGQHDEEIVGRQGGTEDLEPPASIGGRDTESCCVPQMILAASPRISTSA